MIRSLLKLSVCLWSRNVQVEIMSPSAKSWNSVNSGDIGKLKRQEDRHALEVWKGMTIQAMRSPDKRPGSSAASNQRRAFLKPPRLAVGSIHCVYDNLPVCRSTCHSLCHLIPPLRSLTAKNKWLWTRVNKCLADCCVTKTKVAVYLFQDRPTKRLPIVCDKANNGEFCQMTRPFPGTSSKKFEITKYCISVTH